MSRKYEISDYWQTLSEPEEEEMEEEDDMSRLYSVGSNLNRTSPWRKMTARVNNKP